MSRVDGPVAGRRKGDRRVWADIEILPDDSLYGRATLLIERLRRFAVNVPPESLKGVKDGKTRWIRAVNAVAVADSVIEYIAGEESARSCELQKVADRLGYTRVHHAVGSRVSALLFQQPSLFRFKAVSPHRLTPAINSRYLVDERHGLMFVLTHTPGAPDEGIPPTQGVYEREPGAAERLCASQFWVDGDSLDFALEDGSGEVTRPMPKIRDYVGSPSPADLADKIRRRGRTGVLIVGPSGEGKTTLARQTCALLGKKRVLRTGGADNLKHSDEIMRIIEDNKPDALIVDDMQDVFGRHFNLPRSAVLNTLERVNAAGVLLIGTIMEDDPVKLRDIDARVPGALYYPGLRPGRFDIVVTFHHRTAQERFEIMRHYADRAVTDDVLMAIAEQCEGLTGAFLMGLAESLTPDAVASQESIRTLLCMCPTRVVTGATDAYREGHDE